MPENPFSAGTREMQEILPGLFLGPHYAASKCKFNNLLLHGITHIICIRAKTEADFIQPNFPEKFLYLTVEIEDTMMQNIIPHVMKCKDFIDHCLSTGGKCLVHSCDSVSRSPSIIIAYVMGKKLMTYEEALEFVRLKRFCVCPNDHFIQQLKEYEVIYRAEQMALQGQCSQQKGLLKRKHDQSEEEAQSLNLSCEPMEHMT